MLSEKIKKYLDKKDIEVLPLGSFKGEFQIAQEIQEIHSGDTGYEPSIEDIAEQIAFDLLADYPDKLSGWGTYHGPKFVLPNDKGQMIEYPGLKKITAEMLEYWKVRAKECKNPILAARYADIVVDFSPMLTGKEAGFDFFEIVMNANLSIIEKELAEPIDCKIKLERTLALAVKTSNQETIKKVRETALNIEKKAGQDDKPGLWGFSFRWFILGSKNIQLDGEEKEVIVSDMEDRLERVKGDAWLAEHAASLLAEYYAGSKDESNLMRVLGVMEESFKEAISKDSDALIVMHYYEHIREIYQSYGNKGFKEAREADKRLLGEINQLNLDWEKTFKTISVTTQVKQEEIDRFTNHIFGENKENNLEVVMARFAACFIPKPETIEKQLKDVSDSCPMQFLSTTRILDDGGVTIAQLSTLEEDYDKHFQHYALKLMQFGSFMLEIVTDSLKKRFGKDEIADYFEKSVIFENDGQYLERCLSAYWTDDYIVSSHLMCPFIEDAFRKIVKESGGVVLKPNDFGGYDRVSLDPLLKTGDKGQGDIINQIFAGMTSDICMYFRLILTSKLGMNLRNDCSHGYCKEKFFERHASDRLFHVLACLSRIRKSETAPRSDANIQRDSLDGGQI